MTNCEIINLALSSIGGATVALGVAYFLFKQMIKHLIKKESLRYSAQLQEKSEVLKAQLSIYAHEQNVGLTRIDQQRANAIQALYGIITQWHSTAVEIVVPNLVKRETDEAILAYYQPFAKRLFDLSDKLASTVSDSAIFFDQTSYEKLAIYGTSVSTLSIDFYSDTFASEAFQHDPNYQRLLGEFEEKRTRLRSDLKEEEFNGARAILIEEFRILMKAKRTTVNQSMQSDDQQADRR